VRKLAALLAFAAPLAAQAQEARQAGELVRFVSCPIYRDADSGKKSGCWLADDPATGKRWDVSQSPTKPNWDYAVLVEGRVANAPPDPCGASVLDPVRASILPGERCTRHMLPAEGYRGRKFVLPARNIQPLSVAREAPPGPYGERVFTTFFEFDRDFLIYQYDDFIIDHAVTWIRAARPKKLVVTGFAATGPEQVSGRTLAERPEVARERAESIAETLRRLLPGMTVETRWRTGATPVDLPDADTIPGQSQRRAEIRALF